MPYVGSYIWNLRQKVGDTRLIMPAADVVCANEKGEILLVHNRDVDAWTFPGGSVEPDMTWAEAAVQEVLEEGGLVVDSANLTPFMSLSGSGFIYTYKDGSVQFFTIAFATTKFTKSPDSLDATEISAAKWFSLEEAEKLNLSLSAAHILPAYKNWLTANQFQQVTIK